MSYMKKILLIDDEENFCFFLKKNLEATGEFRVFVAYGGEDGFRLAKLEKPDLILLDVMMPKLSGPDVCELLANDPRTKDIPLIFLTAMITQEEIGVEVSRKIGGKDYIAKPVEVKQLIETIKKF